MNKQQFKSNIDEEMPELAKQALSEGCPSVVFYPRGFESIDECGCCDTMQHPGWYEGRFEDEKAGIGAVPGKFICFPDGTPAKQPKWWLP